MLTALRVNEFAQLGDRTIGTAPPLIFQLFTDRSKPRFVSSDGQAIFTIARAAIFSGETEIFDALEQKLAWIFMNYGDWEIDEPEAQVMDNQLESIKVFIRPRERANENEEFEMIGRLSTMFAH